MDDLKQVIAEWVLTNGALEGFSDRVQKTLPLWNVVNEKGLIVYRAQGNGFVSKKGTGDPSSLEHGVRPVLATSYSLSSIVRYAGSECCIFQIYVSPGIRFLNVNSAVTFIDKSSGNPALAIKNDVLKRVQDLCPSSGFFPTNETPLSRMRAAMLDRCFGRVKQYGTNSIEYIPPEYEIMLDGNQGVFRNKKEVGSHGGIKVYTIEYVPRSGGRVKTFRTPSIPRNKKNGRGSAYQSKTRRNSRSRHGRHSNT